MSDTPTLAELGGVTLHQPQTTYALVQSTIGRAVITRKSPNASLLSGGELLIEVSTEARAKLAALASGVVHDDVTATTVRFALSRWAWALRQHGVSGSGAWRQLIVESRLFSHPELLMANKGEAHDRLAAGAADAAAALRRQLDEFVNSPRASGYSAVACDACAESRRHADEAAAMLLSARQRAERRWGPNELPTNCVHEPLGRACLQALFKTYPELAFEAIGWLEPACRARDERQDEPPARFVLTASVMQAILSHWLLEEGPSHWDPYGSDYYGNVRRTNRLTYRAARHAQTGVSSAITADERSALAFAAAGWSIDTPVDSLAAAWARCGDESMPPPVLEAAAVTKTQAVRLLPEMAMSANSLGIGRAKATRTTRQKARGSHP